MTWQPTSAIIDPSGEMSVYDQYGVRETKDIPVERDEKYYVELFGNKG